MAELNFPNPIGDPDDFFDRIEPLETIQKAVISPVRTAVILGERVTGKTSLLNMVMEWAAAQPSLSELRLMPRHSLTEFMREILAGMAAKSRMTLAQFGLHDPTHIAEFVSMAEQLCDRSGQTYLACLDELDSLLEECDQATANEILGFISHVANTTLPLKFVFTMTRLTPLFSRETSPFASASRIARIGAWSRSELDGLVTMLLGEGRLNAAAVDELYLAGGGHPYLTKAILHWALAAAPTPQGVISADEIRTAMTAATAAPEVDLTLTNIITVQFTADELFVLRYLAGRTGPVTPDELQGYLPIFRELQRRGYLRTQDNGFVHAYGLVARWLLERPEANARPRSVTPSILAAPPPEVDVPPLVVDDARHRVFAGATEIQVTEQTFRFLAHVVSQAGSIVSRVAVIAMLWPDDSPNSPSREDALNALFHRLQKALGDSRHSYIEVRRGRGYYANPDHVIFVARDRP